MATIRNNARHVVALTGGKTIAPSEVLAGIDVSGPYEVNLISEGTLTVVDASGPPPAPATRNTSVKAVIPFAHADDVLIDTTVSPMTVDGKSVTGDAVSPAVVEVFGHSLPTAGVPFPTEQSYPQKLGKMLSAAHIWNSAVGGSRSCVPAIGGIRGGWSDIYQRLTRRTTVQDGTNQGGAPYLPQSQVFVHHQALNDLGMLGAANFRPAIEAHRAIWSRALCAAVDENDSTVARAAPDGTVPCTFTGTWTPTNTTLTASGSGYNATTTLNDKFTYRTPADFPGGKFPVVIALVVASTYDFTIGIKIDGVAQPDLRIKGADICDPSIPSNNTFALRFCAGSNLGLPQIAAGGHAIELELKVKTVGGSFLIVDWCGIECQPGESPVVVVPSANRPYTYAIWNGFAHGPLAGGDPMNDASIASVNLQLLALIAEFNTDGTKVLYVEIDTLLAKLFANFAWDQTHLNHAGHAIITEAIHAALIASGMLTVKRLSKYVHRQANMNWQEIGGFNAFGTTFLNSWVNFGSGVSVCAFRLDETGRVQLKGIAKSGTFNLAIFTAPAGFRGREIRYFAALAGLAGATGLYASLTTGDFYCFIGGVNTFAQLEGINYPAEA